MKRQEWKEISHIIDQLMLLPEEQKEPAIDRLCKDDADVKREVVTLLNAIEKSGDFLKKQRLKKNRILQEFHDDLTRETPEPDAELLIGKSLGRWTPTELLGRGGMGAVYKARRSDEDGIQLTAALKILHKSLASPGNLERFRLEQQILASLQHPNIAGFIDSGVTPEGVPYMVMEYIEGEPFLDYCNRHSLSLQQRLELFQTVCTAVQYAHKNLIVHRDLKPRNIFVDGQGNVKILDFGIAKLLDTTMYDLPSVQTQPWARLLSIHYASPEQVAGQPVTTSTDVYSLGVLLYQLLVDLHPFDFLGKTYPEIEQMIRWHTPPLPGIRLSHVQPQQQAAVAAQRHMQPEALIRRLKGDLNAIIAKALHKDPERRYESAEILKTDIERHINGLPVLARPDSPGYRIQTFMRRHRSKVLSTTAVLLAFIVFAVFYVVQVTEQRNIARMEAEKAKRVKDFTTQLFQANDPLYPTNVDNRITLLDVLDTGLKQIETELADEPELYIEMHLIMGESFLNMGEYERAKEVLEKGLNAAIETFGSKHTTVAAFLSLQGALEGELRNYNSALTYLNQVYEIRLGTDGENSVEIAKTLTHIARVYALKGDYERSLKYYRQCLNMLESLGQQSKLPYSSTLTSMAGIQSRLGFSEEAENNYLEGIDLLSQIYRGDHIRISNAYQGLSNHYSRTADFENALFYGEKALDIEKELLPEGHPDLVKAYNSLGLIYLRLGRYGDAEKYHIEAIRLLEEREETTGFDYAIYLNNLALTKSSMGQLDSAATIHNQVLALKQKLLPADHSSITITLYNLGDLHHKLGDLKKAKTLFEQVVTRDKKSLGETHSEMAVNLTKLAAVQRDLQEFADAEQTFQQAEAIYSASYDPYHFRIGEFYREKGRLKMMQNQHEAAQEYFTNSLEIFESHYDEGHTDILLTRNLLEELQRL